MKITYCSVNTPFNEEEPVKRTDDRNADDASRILIHDEQDESHDIIRFKMHYNDNTFMIYDKATILFLRLFAYTNLSSNL